MKLLQDKKRTVDPDQQESYKFVKKEQTNGIKMKEVYERIKGEVNGRILTISEGII